MQRGSNPNVVKTDAPQMSLLPSTTARSLGAVACGLVLASIAGQVSTYAFGHDSLKGFVQLFYVDSEFNVPTFFSVVVMLFISFLLSVIAALNRQQRSDEASRWAVLAGGFLCMSFDEAFLVHEYLSPSVRALLGEGIPGFIHFGWTLPGIALVVIIAMFFRTFVWQLPDATRRRFLTAATLYLGGVLGSDLLLAGPYAAIHGNQNFAYSMLVTVEESLELGGLIVFIWGLLKYCESAYGGVQFVFAAKRSEVLTRERSL